jgi:hypothetical protein
MDERVGLLRPLLDALQVGAHRGGVREHVDDARLGAVLVQVREERDRAGLVGLQHRRPPTDEVAEALDPGRP